MTFGYLGRLLSKAVEDLVKKVRMWKPPKPTEPPKKEEDETEKAEDGETIKEENPQGIDYEWITLFALYYFKVFIAKKG